MDERQSFYIGIKAIVAYKNGVMILKDTAKDKWELPGGRIDQDQGILESLERELTEEILGAKLKNLGPVIYHAVGDFTVENNHKLSLVFYEAEVALPSTIQLSHEHSEAAVATSENLDSFDMFSTDKAAIQKYFSKMKGLS